MIEAIGFFFLGVALTPITGYLQKKLTMIVKTGKLNTESFIYKFFEKYPDLQKVIKEIIRNVEDKLGSGTGEAKMQSAIVFLIPFLPKPKLNL